MALEQHAIPTEVTTYEFRLVGDMTLKQFAWLAGGIIIAILLWLAKPIPFFIRWPLIPFFAILGAAIAFVPFQGRGLDRWIIAFIKAIYSPTEFVWHKNLAIPAYLQANRPVTLSTPSTQKGITVSPSQIEEYLETLTYKRNENIPDQLESTQLTNINSLLNQNTFPQIISQAVIDNPVQTQNIEPDIIESPFYTEPDHSESANNTSPDTPPTTSPQFKELNTPNIETSPDPQVSEPEIPVNIVQAMAAPQEPQIFSPQIQPDTSSSFTSKHLPPPSSLENIVTGVIVDNQDNPLPSAIVEINTENSQPVRALRTNQHGQFTIATPLTPGKYIISADKDNYNINPISFNVANQIITPITLVAQSQSLPS